MCLLLLFFDLRLWLKESGFHSLWHFPGSGSLFSCEVSSDELEISKDISVPVVISDLFFAFFLKTSLKRKLS